MQDAAKSLERAQDEADLFACSRQMNSTIWAKIQPSVNLPQVPQNW